MNETPPPPETRDDDFRESVAEPVLRRKRLFSIVWLIPLVAALAASWMAYDALQSEGPTITIRFDTAEGLVPGKTKIKFKDVEVGQVENIEFTQDLLHVVVTARMIKGVERYLRSETLFWVVRARVTASEVSGLNTLFSGVYIGMQPSKKGKLLSEFQGLAEPPVVTDERQGRHYILRTDDLGSLDVGAPVYFHRVKVGKVVDYELLDNDDVEIKIFVRAPHHKRVHVGTKFWNASGLDMSLDARGVRVEAQSLVSMILGGIAFDTPGAAQSVEMAPPDTVFPLYADRETSFDTSYDYRERYLLHFKGSVRGLSVDAPVEFRGMTIGKVLDVRLQLDAKHKRMRIPVLVEIEPERFEVLGLDKDKAGEGREKVVPLLADMGLRAQLRTGNLLTGQAYVDLDLHPGLPGGGLTDKGGRFKELPTMPSPLEGIFDKAASVMTKLDDLPIRRMGSELRDTMADMRGATQAIRRIMDSVDEHHVLPKAGAMMDQARDALAEVESAMNPNSPARADLDKLLRELTDAARSLRMLVEYLERQPDALLFGKEKP
ncbi:PqiB family protein [Desulfocurvus sp. DL9XJH121]